MTTVTAYRTVARAPANDDGLDADAVLFASGSSVESWCRAFGPTGPPLRVAIGPATAAGIKQAEAKYGLPVTGRPAWNVYQALGGK